MAVVACTVLYTTVPELRITDFTFFVNGNYQVINFTWQAIFGWHCMALSLRHVRRGTRHLLSRWHSWIIHKSVGTEVAEGQCWVCRVAQYCSLVAKANSQLMNIPVTLDYYQGNNCVFDAGVTLFCTVFWVVIYLIYHEISTWIIAFQFGDNQRVTWLLIFGWHYGDLANISIRDIRHFRCRFSWVLLYWIWIISNGNWTESGVQFRELIGRVISTRPSA